MPLDLKPDKHFSEELLPRHHRLFCKSCHLWITAHDWQFSIKGGFEHHVFNPAGMMFHIGCFRDAPGCWATGKPSDEFSWFKGYAWRMALCQGCGKQLGWLFTHQESAFYGLILNRLVDEKALK